MDQESAILLWPLDGYMAAWSSWRPLCCLFENEVTGVGGEGGQKGGGRHGFLKMLLEHLDPTVPELVVPLSTIHVTESSLSGCLVGRGWG